MQVLYRPLILLVLTVRLTIIGNSQRAENESFIGVHHDLGVQYKDPKTKKIYGGCAFRVPKDCQFLYLFIQNWSFDKKKQEIVIEGTLWNIVENKSQPDTLPVQQFEIFTGRPKSDKLYKTKTLMNTWALKTINHNNGFAIKTKFSKQDRLYINAGKPYYLQECFIGNLLD